MNKKIIIIILFLLFIIFLTHCQQKNQSPLKAVKSWKLKNHAFDAWRKIKNDWLRNHFKKILSQFNLKMNCSDCEYIYFDAIISINYKGKLTKLKITHENICGAKSSSQFKKAMFQFLKTYHYPEILRNKMIEIKWGNGLRC